MHKDEEERDLYEDAEWRLSRGDHPTFRVENARAAVVKRLLLEVAALREVCPQLSLEDEPRRRGRTIPSMLAECEDLEALEQDAYVAPKSREGLSLARKIAKLYVAAQHAEARQQPAKDLREVSAELEAMRTTHDERDRVYVGAIASDDELVTVYRRAAEPLGDEHGVSLRDLVRRCQARGVLAVAARVRQERCLVAQAVRMGCGVIISRTSERVPGTTGMWDVYVTRRPDVPGEHYAYGAPAADVPATLARLLGEVAK